MKKWSQNMLPSLSHDNLGTLFTLPNYLNFFRSEKYVKTGEEVVYQL